MMLLVVTMILLGEFATLTLKGCHDHGYGKSMNPAPFARRACAAPFERPAESARRGRAMSPGCRAIMGTGFQAVHELIHHWLLL